MNKTLLRSTLVGATAVATAAVIGSAAQVANADPGDAVTGGTTTITVPAATVLSGGSAGIVAIPQTPASVGYDKADNAAAYLLPVTGGDGSGNADYGSLKHGGSLLVVDFKTHRSVTLSQITFSFDDFALSATPAGSTTSVKIADVTGTTLFSSDRATGRQELSSSDLQVDAAGAAYLDKALKTTVIKAGAHVGSFDTVFYNSQY